MAAHFEKPSELLIEIALSAQEITTRIYRLSISAAKLSSSDELHCFLSPRWTVACSSHHLQKTRCSYIWSSTDRSKFETAPSQDVCCYTFVLLSLVKWHHEELLIIRNNASVSILYFLTLLQLTNLTEPDQSSASAPSDANTYHLDCVVAGFDVLTLFCMTGFAVMKNELHCFA